MFTSSFGGGLPNIWGPILTELEKLAAPCARGYAKLSFKLLEDFDSALKRNDSVCFGMLLKNSVNVFEQLLPYIQHKRTRDVIHQIGVECAKHSAKSANRSIDLNKLNELSRKYSKDLIDSINSYLGKN